jgi:hypothetical protein
MAIRYKKCKRLDPSDMKTEIVADDLIMRSEDNFTTTVWVPFDDRNVDYKAYKAWLDEGNTPEAAA